MNRRTVVLLVVAIVLWIAVIGYYLFTSGKLSLNFFFFKRSKSKPTKIMQHSIASVKITPEFLESYENLVHEDLEIPDVFTPYYTEKGNEYMRDLIIESPDVLNSLSFVGYMITPSSGRVYLKSGNVIKSYALNDLILDRYLIIYISSIGVVVLDVKEGGLKVIK